MTVKEGALEYILRYKFSLFPMQVSRKPCLPWLEYQSRLPSADEAKAWFDRWPDANVALVTGRVSGITVLDVDTAEGYRNIQQFIPNDLRVPTVRSPSGGWHLYFQYLPTIRNAELVPGVEGKNDRSNITAPPSIGMNGKPYTWEIELCDDLPVMPHELEVYLSPKQSYPAIVGKDMAKRTLQFKHGGRDNSLFSIANALAKTGMPMQDIEEVIKRLAVTCDPPFEDEEASAKAKSAVEFVGRKGRNLGVEVRDWIAMTNGWFSLDDIYKTIGDLTPKDKSNVRMIMHRLSEEGFVEKHDKQWGKYRRPDSDVEEIKWQDAPDTPIELMWPLDIQGLGIKVYPGNVIVVAGDNNAGKTAFLLNLVKMNMDKMEIHYFSNDMLGPEFHRRLKLFKDIPDDGWKFKAWDKSGDFEDVIRPDAINIIDFLQEHDEFWLIGKHIQKIWEKLGKGIAIIAIQKDFEREMGLGGTFGMHKCRVYLSMKRGRIKILKAKLWDGHIDPNNFARKFQLYDGAHMEPLGPWYYDIAPPKDKRHGKD